MFNEYLRLATVVNKRHTGVLGCVLHSIAAGRDLRGVTFSHRGIKSVGQGELDKVVQEVFFNLI
jgi:hypothetical protein